MRRWLSAIVVASSCQAGLFAEDGLIAHWPLAGDAKDVSGSDLHLESHGVTFAEQAPGRRGAAAVFDGRQAWLQAPLDERLKFGTGDFSISLFARPDEALDDVPGDLLSQYDFKNRRGFHLALKTNPGVTFSQSNCRQLQFGIDQSRMQKTWKDRGNPGNCLLAFALCTMNGSLYAGTCEPGAGDAGHVYRFAGGDRWIDCGAPDRSNAVTSLVEFDGSLYAGTGRYRLGGSSLPESPNATLGGRVFRYEGGSRWVDCGRLPETEAVGGLVVFRGGLYASSLYRPAGFFRYEGGQSWSDCGSPLRPKDLPGETTHMRAEALGVYNGWLYATCYDGGRVFRFDGKAWHDCGQLAENTQTYAFAVRSGRFYVGTWRTGRVYRFEEPFRWTDVGRLGEELEVMGMLVHNGRLIAGTLPLAEVYEFNGESAWTKLARLDHTPDVRYRRAWTMAEYDGQVFCSTLPSGRVYSWRSGRVAMTDRRLPDGWHHVAAVRSKGALRLFVDGKPAAEESGFDNDDFDLTNSQPLKIGFGPNDYFKGHLAQVRIYDRALSPAEIRTAAGTR